METIEVGSQVIRKGEKYLDTGTVEAIRNQRARVRWRGSNVHSSVRVAGLVLDTPEEREVVRLRYNRELRKRYERTQSYNRPYALYQIIKNEGGNPSHPGPLRDQGVKATTPQGRIAIETLEQWDALKGSK